VRRAIVGALCCAWLGACATDPREGYSSRSSYSSDVRTISVPMVRNGSNTVGVEAELTEAIIKEIQRATPWTVTSAPTADTTLVATLGGSEMKVLSTSPDSGYVQELGVAVSVDFQWRDNRTSKVLVERRSFSAMDTFVPERRSGERLETGRSAAIQRLARDVVAELRESW
jgi:hypothetical protein